MSVARVLAVAAAAFAVLVSAAAPAAGQQPTGTEAPPVSEVSVQTPAAAGSAPVLGTAFVLEGEWVASGVLAVLSLRANNITSLEPLAALRELHWRTLIWPSEANQPLRNCGHGVTSVACTQPTNGNGAAGAPVHRGFSRAGLPSCESDSG